MENIITIIIFVLGKLGLAFLNALMIYWCWNFVLVVGIEWIMPIGYWQALVLSLFKLSFNAKIIKTE